MSAMSAMRPATSDTAALVSRALTAKFSVGVPLLLDRRGYRDSVTSES